MKRGIILRRYRRSACAPFRVPHFEEREGQPSKDGRKHAPGQRRVRLDVLLHDALFQLLNSSRDFVQLSKENS